jgi:hypothetical protein
MSAVLSNLVKKRQSIANLGAIGPSIITTSREDLNEPQKMHFNQDVSVAITQIWPTHSNYLVK